MTTTPALLRRSVIVSLALLVAFFGVESAVHSVHHLSDPEGAASCALFLMSEDLQGACAATPDAGTAPDTPAGVATVDRAVLQPAHVFNAHEGRAPPLQPSV